MQVFKLYYKMLLKNAGMIIMYLAIYISILVGAIIPQFVGNDTPVGYSQSNCKYAIFDYDNSNLSAAICDYLSSNHNVISISDDKLETIQDELYALNVDAVIRIQSGFENNFNTDSVTDYLEIYSIPERVSAILLEQQINSYLSTIQTYLIGGFNIENAIDKTDAVLAISVEATLADTESASVKGASYYFYTYANWIFLAIGISSIGMVLIALDRKSLKDRMECSAYPFIRINLEVILGVITTGFALCGICILMSFIFLTDEIPTASAILYMINAFCAMAYVLAITFLVSKLTHNPQASSFLSNIIGLGMAFLCGIFVPMEFLSDSVIKVAHFLPAYWNVRAIELIDKYTPAKLSDIFTYMGIQLLFTIALLFIGMIIARKKRVTISA